MESISATVWQRKGSSVVFDRQSLSPFIATGWVVSLRQALGWRNNMPSTPPDAKRTILVSGLETMLEILPPQEAYDFLVRRVRPLLMELQNCWTDCGVVFRFAAHPQAFKEQAMDEEVIYLRRDKKEIRLSEGLWDGTATVNMKRIVRADAEQGKEDALGYYVARIS
jgi:hypothetical protein